MLVGDDRFMYRRNHLAAAGLGRTNNCSEIPGSLVKGHLNIGRIQIRTRPNRNGQGISLNMTSIA